MATSGTTTFDLSFDRIIERAYARCGQSLRTGYQLTAARDNLNLLFSEWGNRGVHLWKVTNQTTNLTAGTTTYTAPSDTSDVLEAVFRETNTDGTITDTTLTKISRSQYEALPNKQDQGRPSQYFIRRNLANVEINLYQTPDTTDTQINYYYVARIEDVGDYTNTADAPYRFLPCTVSGLAYYLAQEIAPDRIQMLGQVYETELNRALNEDTQRVSAHIVPMRSYI
jgi:hypothetical protein